jgi:hypothetical protein
MPTTLLTYDIDREHKAFKKQLKAMGYSDQVEGSNSSVNLPNTTMFHHDKTASGARADAKKIAQSLGVDLERCFAAEISTWAAIVGDKHVD